MIDMYEGRKPTSGVGCALYVKFPTDTKYHIAMPLETIPSITGSPNSIEFDLTTSDVIGHVKGKMQLEDGETEFFAHRDNFNIAKKMVEAGELDFLIVNPDYTGWKFTAEVDYRQNEVTASDLLKGTLTIIPSSIDKEYYDNVYDLIMPTVKFKSAIPDTITLKNVTDKQVINVLLEPTEATVAVSYLSDGYESSGTSTVATAVYATNQLTITAKAVGSEVIKLTASLSEYASWETFIHVVVLAGE